MAIHPEPIRTQAAECRGRLESLIAHRRRLATEIAAVEEQIELARVDLAVATQRDLEIPLPQPSTNNGAQLLRATEAAAMLGISKTAIYDLHKVGRLPAVRPTGDRGALRFRVEDVQRYARDPEAFVAPSLIPAAFRPRRQRKGGRA